MTSDSPHLRFAIVGIVTVSLFAALFARLWFLQVMTATEYEKVAGNLAVREVQEEAPRGRILDRQGEVLVDNRRSIQVSVDWQAYNELGGPEQNALLTKLARLLTTDSERRAAGLMTNPAPGAVPSAYPDASTTTTTSTSTTTSSTTTTTAPILGEDGIVGPAAAVAEQFTAASLKKRLNDSRFSHFKPVPVATDVSESLEIYLVEHASDFPTVEAKRVTVRQYRYGSLLAHVLGYVGTVSEADLDEFQNADKPYELSDEVGKSGIEKSMEAQLRGVPGVTRYEVDARNQPVKELSTRAATPGNDVYLSIDINLQYIVERSLAAQLSIGRPPPCDRSGCYERANTGASVVTDPNTGQILAMASYPTYDPRVFIGGISQERWDALNDKRNGEPFLNRAIGGQYAPGSTWKLISAVSGLTNQVITPEQIVGDGGVYRIANCEGRCEFTNGSSRIQHGAVDLTKSLRVSSDVYYYRVGDQLWQKRGQIGDDALARTATEWGFGAQTGIGLGGERAGALPTPDRKLELAQALYPGDEAKIADYGTWRTGDNLNSAIGQGYVEVTPLQLVNGYATFANGGTLYAPNFVVQVAKPFSDTMVELPQPVVVRQVNLPPEWRDPMLAGFQGVTQAVGGTAFTTFEGFPQASFPVAGKTGTAQVTGKADTSLFAAFAPATAPKFAVVAILPEAGNGGDAAAPLVRRILEPLAEVSGDLRLLKAISPAPIGGSFDPEDVIAEGRGAAEWGQRLMASVLLPKHRPISTMNRNPSSAYRHLDFVLIGCVGLIASFGLLMVYSATRGAEQPYDSSFVKKQLMFFVLGSLVMAAATIVDYRQIRDFAPFIYGGSLVLLLGVKVLGKEQNGTQGWYQLGPFQLQPSELAKLGLIIGFSWLASQYQRDIDNRRFLSLLAVAGAPMFLVMLQPDLGTTLVSGAITVTLLVVSGAKPRQLAALGALTLFAIVVILRSGMLGDYQQDRFSGFLNQPDALSVDLSEATNAEYNLAQSKIAIGAGGITGEGLFNGTQTRLKNVPFQHTDFIFTAVGEQLGLVGAAGLMTVFSVLVWRIWRTAQLARDDFGMMVCAGIMAVFVFQIFENVGMTMGIMPITGIPLPFMSYGGSSTITYMAMMGLVLNVHMRRFS